MCACACVCSYLLKAAARQSFVKCLEEWSWDLSFVRLGFKFRWVLLEEVSGAPGDLHCGWWPLGPSRQWAQGAAPSLAMHLGAVTLSAAGHDWPPPALTMASLRSLPSFLEPPVSCRSLSRLGILPGDSGRPDTLRAEGSWWNGGIPGPVQDSGGAQAPELTPGHLQPQSCRGTWPPLRGASSWWRGADRSLLGS